MYEILPGTGQAGHPVRSQGDGKVNVSTRHHMENSKEKPNHAESSLTQNTKYKTVSSTQTVIVSSSGESEFYANARGTPVLDMKSMARDYGNDFKVVHMSCHNTKGTLQLGHKAALDGDAKNVKHQNRRRLETREQSLSKRRTQGPERI